MTTDVAAGGAAGVDLPAWLTDPALDRLWAAARHRLERNGLEARGRVVLGELSREERHALAAVLGRAVVNPRLGVDLGALDEALRLRSGVGGLADVIGRATGSALHDRRAERASASADRAQPLLAARARLSERPELADAAWIDVWLQQIRKSGVLSRTTPASATDVMERAAGVLADLVPRASAPSEARPLAGEVYLRADGAVPRAELSARLVGTAHGLDDGSALATIVLRGLALAADVPAPVGTEQKRLLWQHFRVLADTVSTTCLALGLAGTGVGSAGARLALAAQAGEPMHLTAWDVRGLTTLSAPGPVLVCENPSVLEAVAHRFGSAVPMVCGMGQPALVVLDVLVRLSHSGVDLRYHGDFDWPGIAITNRLVEVAGVRPWRMTAESYVAGLRAPSIPLAGTPLEASWDADLGAAMRATNAVVHEEAVLDDLLVSLPIRLSVE